MNTQLLLIDVKPLTPNNSSGARKQQEPRLPWWKLSEEEKLRGIQGVRAIKAILNQSSDSNDLFYAHAS